jgi:pyroglutamyl-peptidase
VSEHGAPRGGHVLLTGFEPFGADTQNPSRELAKALDGRVIGGLSVRGLVLPVEHQAARELVGRALAEPDLRAVVHLGLAGGRSRIALERVGVNVMDYTLPDNAGATMSDTPCVPGGPAAYRSTLPIAVIRDRMLGHGIPAYVSYTAGTYLCNFTLYTTLHTLDERGLDVPAGFIHLPYLPAMVAAHGQDEPSMDLPLMQRAVEIALAALGGS